MFILFTPFYNHYLFRFFYVNITPQYIYFVFSLWNMELFQQEFQILEELYIKITKPSLTKISFKYCSYILKCMLPFIHHFFLLPQLKFFSFVNSTPICSFYNYLYMSCGCHYSLPWRWLQLEPNLFGKTRRLLKYFQSISQTTQRMVVVLVV